MLTVKTKELYDLTHTLAAPLLEKYEYPWEALKDIKQYTLELGKTLSAEEYDCPAEGIWVQDPPPLPPRLR